MRKHITLLMFVLLILSLALAACAPSAASATDGEDVPTDEELPPVAAIKAREALAAELGLTLSQVTIISQEQVTWTDSCLGLGGPAESCLRADTPGWLVTLEADGATYEAHTDELGEQVRVDR